MAARGVPGLAVTSIVAGGVLMLSGLRGGTVADTLRALVKGDYPLPEGKPLTASAGLGAAKIGQTAGGNAAGTAMGAKVAQDAQGYVGVPYVWAGETPQGWDCSGFVTWVLHHDNGIDLPSSVHTTAIVFYGWPGATTIPRSQCAAGDLLCWGSHVAIAISGTHMVHAPGVGKKTQVSRIWALPAPTVRRPKAYGGG